MVPIMTDPVELFYLAVNARAEWDILAGGPVTGAHHRALEAEIAKYRALMATAHPRVGVLPARRSAPVFYADDLECDF